MDGHPPRTASGGVRVVVEIPTGTTAKWEVDKHDGALRWELEDGQPRVVRYLGYPGNYGMIPRTLAAAADGGDGDPLDVLVLGDAVTRGTIVEVRLIGVLEMWDGGERDHKLLAVRQGTPFARVRDVADLDREFPGVTTIVEAWFRNYKGAGKIETRGFAGAGAAESVLESAIRAYAASMGEGGKEKAPDQVGG